MYIYIHVYFHVCIYTYDQIRWFYFCRQFFMWVWKSGPPHLAIEWGTWWESTGSWFLFQHFQKKPNPIWTILLDVSLYPHDIPIVFSRIQTLKCYARFWDTTFNRVGWITIFIGQPTLLKAHEKLLESNSIPMESHRTLSLVLVKSAKSKDLSFQ